MYLPPITGAFGSRIVGPSRWRLVNIVIATIMIVLVSPVAAAAERAIVLQIDGVIGPATADYVLRQLRTVRPSEIGLVVLRMNTPGGLDTSMRAIIRSWRKRWPQSERQ